MNFNSNRRDFLKSTSIGTLAAIGLPQIVAAAFEHENIKKIKLEKDNIILFQGDSITDWGRGHRALLPNTTNSLGAGYVLLTAAQLLQNYPGKNLFIYNKGVSGDKVFQLNERWESDCLLYKPDILSIHVGVNDFWHSYVYGYKGTVDTYIADYQKLLNRTKLALPDIKLVICEPFAVNGVGSVDDRWLPFDRFRKAARAIAAEHHAAFVPFQAVFDKAVNVAPAAYWSIDGIHPSVAGTALMAKAWTEVIASN
jgi:lysophospholipase L1-like esterase